MASKAAYLSHGAIIVIVVDANEKVPPMGKYDFLPFHAILRLAFFG